MGDTIAYSGRKPYAFVSYSHADRARVERLLRILHRYGRRFWYDAAINYSDNWEQAIDQALQGSCMFILFMTNGVEQRPEIIRELKAALKRQAQGEYRIFIVLLERVPIRHLFRDHDDLLAMLSRAQYIAAYSFGGITMSFVETLAGRSIWQYALTKRELTQEKARPPVLASLEDISNQSGYIYPYASPADRTADGVDFHMLQVGETDPHAVYPICMDNQWCPPAYFADEDFRREGFQNQALQARRTAMQQKEVIRALLHNWQVLINRASIFNTAALAQWYAGPEPDRGAFCQLLRSGSLVVYLMNERSPVEKPRGFAVDEAQFRAWCELCRSNAIYCIRMSWEDVDGRDAANRFEISRRLAMQLQELLLTTASDPYRLEAFRRAMGIPDGQADAFRLLWQQVRRRMAEQDDAAPGRYSRDNLYRDFLIREDTNVPDCILDYDKPFVRELKQIVDFRYALNLPAALRIHPMSSYENRLWDYEMSERRSYQQMRVISADELFCAAVLFRQDFLRRTYRCEADCVTLSDAAQIRLLPEWTAYMEALDAARKRASLNEIDFHDVEVIFGRYRALLAACARALPALRMKEEPGCLSLIYQFGTARLAAVYRQGDETVHILTDEKGALSDKLRENMAIDFMFGPWTPHPEGSSCFVQRLRLFEGVLQQSPRTAYGKVLSALQQQPHTMERMDAYEL